MNRILAFLKKHWIILLILLVATFLRFYQLNNIPFGLYPDEAANGLDIIRMMEEGDHRVVYDTNGPRESLFFYGQGAFVWLGKTFNIEALRYTPLSLRIASALAGIATVFALYLLAKELFNRNVGLISAAALAVSAWHIQFSRNGFRAIMLPLMLCFLFYFFIKAFRDGAIKDYLWFAVFLALGFYTYLSIRMVPLIFIAFIVWAAFYKKNFIKDNIKKIGYALGLFLVLMIPMFIHFVNVPADIVGRSSTSIFNPELNNGSALRTLGENVVAEVMMFNFEGDNNFRHNLGGSPMLDIVTGLFFWVGLLWSLLKIKKIEHFILWSWFGAMSLPMILTAEGIPHALRLVGAMPVIFIWIGLGVNYLAEKIPNKKWQYAFVAIVLLAAGGLGFKKYFIDFPSYAEAREAYSEDMVIMANDLKKSPEERENILLTGGFGLKTVDFITHQEKPKMRQFETYQIADHLFLPADNFKIYVARSWLPEVERELAKKGYKFEFGPVKSDLDDRILYYEYQN